MMTISQTIAAVDGVTAVTAGAYAEMKTGKIEGTHAETTTEAWREEITPVIVETPPAIAL